MSTIYNESFYRQISGEERSGRDVVGKLIVENFPGIASAIDIGCGVGNWLETFKRLGVGNVLGVDGPWIPGNALKIKSEEFLQCDFRQSFPVIDRRFDLAISLEVAEHLPHEKSEDFIAFLTNLADIILFSAAIPGQGGVGHINEQWPAYWSERFSRRDFTLYDILRKKIWLNEDVPYWYRQNLLVAVRNTCVTKYNTTGWEAPLPLVHFVPQEEIVRISRKPLPNRLWRMFRQWIKDAFC